MLVFLAILSVPLIEIALFILIGGAIGLWWTLAWVVLAAAFGIILLKGIAMLGAGSINHDMTAIMSAQSPQAHKVLVLLAGLLLLVPGFFTDAIGILLLFRPIRAAAIRMIGRKLQALSAQAMVIDGEWHETTTFGGKPLPKDPPGQ